MNFNAFNRKQQSKNQNGGDFYNRFKLHFYMTKFRCKFHGTLHTVKGETRAHRMWFKVLLVMYNKCNMAAETGSRNNLHSR